MPSNGWRILAIFTNESSSVRLTDSSITSPLTCVGGKSLLGQMSKLSASIAHPDQSHPSNIDPEASKQINAGVSWMLEDPFGPN